MDNYFTQTLVDTITQKIAEPKNYEDEKIFLADLFNEKLFEIGHIQFIPAQNRISITASLSKEEDKVYHIKEPQLELLKFLFKNTDRKAKKAIRNYFLNSSSAQKQFREAQE